MTTHCQRCQRIAPVRPYGQGGLLWLCAACPLEPDCGVYRHKYYGSASAGVWVCLRCGGTLTSEPSNPAALDAAEA
jgi:hypothetical protein